MIYRIIHLRIFLYTIALIVFPRHVIGMKSGSRPIHTAGCYTVKRINFKKKFFIQGKQRPPNNTFSYPAQYFPLVNFTRGP